MLLYPAVDIRGGRTVRLAQGDYARETVFDADPLDAARRWLEQGAEALHVVDLDGARAGTPVNLAHIGRIAEAAGEVPVQVGGGLRDEEAVHSALGAGASRAVLGTAAQRDPDLVERLARRYGRQLVVSIDARAGEVAVEGWEQSSGVGAAELLASLAARGARCFVFTPVEVDGTLGGPGLAQLSEVAGAAGRAGTELVYSGGVGSLDHLRQLGALRSRMPALAGAIVGRALYEGRFTVGEARTALGSAGAGEGDG